MKKSELGQALLIVLLVMAVGLTMGLAVVSRSVTDIRISQQEEESARAFSAAEAGIEGALLENLAVGDVRSEPVGDIEYTVTATEQGGQADYDFGGGTFSAGDTQTVWLVGHNSSGEPDPGAGSYSGSQVDLYWGNEGQADDEDTTPALEASIIYEDSGFKVIRYAFDPYSTRTPPNEFDNAQVGSFPVAGQTFPFKAEITSLPSGTLYALRLKLLYNSDSQALAIVGSEAFPSQGKCYVSTAAVEESGVTRKIQQCQTYKAPPAIFDYVLFSGGDLVHQ